MTKSIVQTKQCGCVQPMRALRLCRCNFKFWLNTICLPIYYAITSYCIAFSRRLSFGFFFCSCSQQCNSSDFLRLLFISFGENVGKFIRDAIIRAFRLQWGTHGMAKYNQYSCSSRARCTACEMYTDVEMQFSLASHKIKLTCLTQHFTNCAQLKQFYLTILRCASDSV